MARQPVRCPVRTALHAFVRDANVEDDMQLLQDETKPWNLLPYNVLVQVVHYLQDVERRSVALVCHAWYTATTDPALWREKQFFLYSDHQIPTNKKWLQQHGNHLRHATVMCFGTFESKKRTFLKQLWMTRLKSLALNGTAYWWSKMERGGLDDSIIVTEIVKLINSQPKLTSFQMGQALLSLEAGIHILTAVAFTSGSTITRLGLEDFFCESENSYPDETHQPHSSLCLRSAAEQFMTCVAMFPHLSELTVNFRFVTDELLNYLSKNRRHQSLSLNVISWQEMGDRYSYRRKVRNCQDALVYAWRNLATSCRPVKVNITLQNIKDFNAVRTSVLFNTIPLSRLSLLGLMSTINERETGQLVQLLKHIETSFSKSIVGIRLWGDNKPCYKIEDALIALVSNCPWLVDVDLRMDLQPAFVGRICSLQQKQTISLQSFHLARSLNSSAEFDEFRRYIQHWYPYLKNLKLTFQIRAESSPIHCAFKTYSFLVADNRGILDHVEGKDNSSCWQCVHNVGNHTNNDDRNSSNHNSNNNSCYSNKSKNTRVRSVSNFYTKIKLVEHGQGDKRRGWTPPVNCGNALMSKESLLDQICGYANEFVWSH